MPDSNATTAYRADTSDDIAVIAASCVFPGANSLDELATLLFDGKEAIARFTDEELKRAGVPEYIYQRPDYVPARPIIDGIDLFDAAFFGYAPREAELIDPQQRLFLEQAWLTLEQAGYDPHRYDGRIGLFAGTGHNGYFHHQVLGAGAIEDAGARLEAAIASDKDHLTTRAAYKLNLHGPAVSVQSTCSTSLVALCLAADSLKSGRSDMALAGGVSISSQSRRGYIYRQGGILSSDGRCKPFDASSTGTVFGDGVGIVLLKRLTDARRDGDRVLGVILGAAINNDGSEKIGYTAPSVAGQASVIREAHRAANVTPDEIGMIEAHGTGTQLGDPIEFRALHDVFGDGKHRAAGCSLGSVKANIGHLNAASGIAGFMRALVAVGSDKIPPHPNFSTPNRAIDLTLSPFHIHREPVQWPSEYGRRIAGVSSFGIGGTNAHVVLGNDTAPVAVPSSEDGCSIRIIPISAKTETAVRQYELNLARHLERSAPNLADLAHTLQTGRREFEYRSAVVAVDLGSARKALDAHAGVGRIRKATGGSVAFMFPGQGSLSPGQTRVLYERDSEFKGTLDRCARLFQEKLGIDILEVLYRSDSLNRAAAGAEDTAVAQPLVFSLSYSLAAMWMSWGVRPTCLIGHSLGEYVAATVAGVFSLEDAVDVIAERARLMAAAPQGRMLHVGTSAATVASMRDASALKIEIAALNAEHATVVAGECDEIERFAALLQHNGVATVALRTSRAFHSRLMDSVTGPLIQKLSTKVLDRPAIPFVSNVTGTWITEAQALDPAYWARHTRECVRFSAGLATVAASGVDVFLEVGTGTTLSGLARENAFCPQPTIVSTCQGGNARDDEYLFAMTALAELWTRGASVDWQALDRGAARRRIPLPGYAFERRRFWVTVPEHTQTGRTSNESRFERRDAAQGLYTINWRRLPALTNFDTAALSSNQTVLVFDDGNALGRVLVHQLRELGATVITVHDEPEFNRRDPFSFGLKSAAADDNRKLVQALRASNRMPDRVIDLRSCCDLGVRGAVQDALDTNFFAPLWFFQAWAEIARDVPLDFSAIVAGLHCIESGDEIDPARALIVGPRNVIKRELTSARFRTIDVAPQDLMNDPEHVADRLIRETQANQRCNDVALRGTHRWTRSVDPLPALANRRPADRRERSTVLITGGLGALGLALAEHYAGDGVTLILASRRADSPQDAGIVSVLQRLRERGADIVLTPLDVGDEAGVALALDGLYAKFARLDLVIHAAGVSRGGLAELTTREDALRVLWPKVQGTLSLLKALSGRPCESVVLCSSNDALRGGLGQIDYVSANAFLDAVAQAQCLPNTRLISVNLPALLGGGMAEAGLVDGAVQRGAQRNARKNWLPIGEVGRLFDQILDQPYDHVSIAPGGIYLEELIQQRTQDEATCPASQEALTAPHAAADSGRKPGSRMYPRPAHLTEAFVAPTTDVELAVARVWSTMLGIEPISLDDNFFALGGHSLMAVRLAFRLREQFGVDFGFPDLLANPTIRLTSREIHLKQLSLLPEDDLNALIAEFETESGEELL